MPMRPSHTIDRDATRYSPILDEVRPGGGLIAWVTILIGAIPLLVASPVPLQDWPNHVAGAHVLAGLLESSPFWARFYTLNTFLVPNAAVDLGLLGLRALGMAEAAAGNIFVLATYAVFMAALLSLCRTLGAFDATKPPLAVLLFYGVALFWGLVNYVLALSVMFGLLAIWLRWERSAARRLALAGLGCVPLLFIHAIPAVVLPLLLVCFDFARWRAGASWRSCGSGPLALVVVVVVLRLLPGHTGTDLAAVYSGAGSLHAFVLWKLRIFGTIPLGGSLVRDGVSLLAWLGSAAAIAIAAKARLSWGTALAVAALLLLTLAAPERLGTGSLLDVRLAVLPVMLAVMGVRLTWRDPGLRRLCVGSVVLLVVGRTAMIARDWRAAGAVYAAFDQQAARLPPGSLMVLAFGRPRADITWQTTWAIPMQSMAAAVVSHGLFYPATFANPDQQPIARKPVFDPLGQPWNFSTPQDRRQSLAGLGEICASHAYAGVFVTVLYGAAPFEIVDACAPT